MARLESATRLKAARKYGVISKMHQGAAVCSGALALEGALEEERLKSAALLLLCRLRDDCLGTGGVIGHIKCFFQYEGGGFTGSCTGYEATLGPAAGCPGRECRVSLAAIAFGVELRALEGFVIRALEGLSGV